MEHSIARLIFNLIEIFVGINFLANRDIDYILSAILEGFAR
jgi:hypothetical protein